MDCKESALDGTRKYLFGLADGNVVESVFMRYHHGNSVCISSQVGCRMGCHRARIPYSPLLRDCKRKIFPYIFPGVQGKYSSSHQNCHKVFYGATHRSGRREIPSPHNVVVMGTGEPFDNYDNLIRFLKMISDDRGLNISGRNVTVSTCGIVPRIRQFGGEGLTCNLALSLHAPNSEVPCQPAQS